MPRVKPPAQQTAVRLLTPAELQRLAHDAGFRGDALRWAVAIAMAESGGNPSSYNPEIAAGTRPGSGSRGLWQIYGAAHPEYNSSLAFDPVTNARAAFAVYREAGGSFRPWSAFTKGTAKPFYDRLGNLPSLGNGQSAAGLGIAAGGLSSSLPGYVGGAVEGNNNPLEAAKQTSQALQDIASGKFIENWFSKFDKVSFTFYAGGILLMLIGLLVIFARPVTSLVIEGTKAAATGGISAAL